MAYDPSTPDSITEFRSISAEKMRRNFRAMEQYYDRDHYGFANENEDARGKHRKFTLVEVADPSTAADEIALYAKDYSGTTNLATRYISDGAVSQVSSGIYTVQNGLSLLASVVFDAKGNLVNTNGDEGDDMAFGVSSVTQVSANQADYQVNFSPSLPTSNYMWVVNGFSAATRSGVFNAASFQVKPNATYGDSVATSSLKIQELDTTGTLSQDINVLRISLQVYGVL